MNGLLIVVLLILLVSVVRGYRRGFIRVLFSLIGLLLVLTFAVLATPHVSAYLQEHTTVYARIEERCTEKVHEKTEITIDEKSTESAGIFEQMGIKLPDGFADQLTGTVTGSIDQAIEDSGVYQQIGRTLAIAIVNGIAFVISCIIAAIVIAIIRKILVTITDLPGIKVVNRMLGLVAGLVEGLVAVWVLMYLIGLVTSFDSSSALLTMIDESRVLSYLYDHNGLVAALNILL